MDLSGEWLKAIFTAATILISYFGYRLSRRGQEASNREQKFTQEFAALKQVNDALTAENARLDRALTRAREDLERSEAREKAAVDVVHEEWEPRWARQLGRCRAVTSSLVETIVSLQRVAPAKKRAEAQRAIDILEQHRSTDHVEMRELGTEDDTLGP